MQQTRRDFLRSGMGCALAGMAANECAAALAETDADARAWWSIAQVKDSIVTGKWTSAEATEFMLQRIKAIDGGLNSYLTVMEAEAREIGPKGRRGGPPRRRDGNSSWCPGCREGPLLHKRNKDDAGNCRAR